MPDIPRGRDGTRSPSVDRQHLRAGVEQRAACEPPAHERLLRVRAEAAGREPRLPGGVVAHAVAVGADVLLSRSPRLLRQLLSELLPVVLRLLEGGAARREALEVQLDAVGGEASRGMEKPPPNEAGEHLRLQNKLKSRCECWNRIGVRVKNPAPRCPVDEPREHRVFDIGEIPLGRPLRHERAARRAAVMGADDHLVPVDEHGDLVGVRDRPPLVADDVSERRIPQIRVQALVILLLQLLALLWERDVLVELLEPELWVVLRLLDAGVDRRVRVLHRPLLSVHRRLGLPPGNCCVEGLPGDVERAPRALFRRPNAALLQVLLRAPDQLRDDSGVLPSEAVLETQVLHLMLWRPVEYHVGDGRHEPLAD